MLYATGKVREFDLYKEYKSLRDCYYKTSLNKEFKQQSYLSKYSIFNNSTGEFIKMGYSFSNYYKKYIKSMEQKIYALEEESRDMGLIPVFLTFTLQSEFHPFISKKYADKRVCVNLNSNFEFNSLKEAIYTGYQSLNNIFRIFYKRLKNNIATVKYIKVFEMHKTMVPHMHLLFFIKPDQIKILRRKYVKIKHEFYLNQTSFDLIQNKKELNKGKIKTGINRASKYILKYVLKSLDNGKDFFEARLLDGWKRVNKIRIITSSNLSLTLSDYRTIYHNISQENNDKLLKKAKAKNQSIFYYIMKNITIVKIVKQNTKQSILKQFSKLENSSIILFKVIEKLKFNGAYRSKIDKLTLFINHALVYEKQNYIHIKNEV